MQESIREQILQTTVRKLQEIRLNSGYDIEVKTVERARRRFTGAEIPAISLFDNNETAEFDYNTAEQTLTLSVEFHDDAGSLANRSTHANLMLACLKQALQSLDVSGCNEAQAKYITSSVVSYPPDDDVNTVSVTATFTVLYQEVIDDPFENQ